MVRTLLGKPRALRPLQATDLAVTASYMIDGLSEAKRPRRSQGCGGLLPAAVHCITTTR